MAKKKEVRLKKIPLANFLDTLTELLAFGVEYIDIVGTPGEEQDVIGIIYSNDYMSKDMQSKIDEAIDEFLREEEEEMRKNKDLSDDDLNQLS